MVHDCATLSVAARSFGNHCSTPLFRATSYRCAVAAGVGAGTESHSVSEAICPAGNCGHVRYARQLYQGGDRNAVVQSNQNR